MRAVVSIRAGQREQAHAKLSGALERYPALDMLFWQPQGQAALKEESQP